MTARRRAVVLVLLPVLAACGTASSAAVSAATASGRNINAPSAPPSVAAPTTAAATAAPAKPDEFPDRTFAVTAPVLVAPSGPGTIQQRPCKPADVTASAALRPVPGGVDGVIRMVGKGCSLHVVDGPTALLGADGDPLDVTLDQSPTPINPGANPHWGVAFTDGDGLWGFSWRGSWCGAKPAFVLVPMADDPRVSPKTGPYGDLRVPLSGAAPACSDKSDSVLQPGLPGGEGNDTINPGTDALQLPPPSWAGLRASLTASSTVDALRLTNITDTAITLLPCPDYGISASYALVRGSGDEGGSATLPCAQHSPDIPAHGSATYTIPGPDLSDLSSDPVRPGTLVQFQIAIAGIATASIDQAP